MADQDIVDAINDLTRVILATGGKYKNKSEAIRSLNDLSIPNTRIASIFAMQTKDVASVLAKQDKKKTNK